MALWVRSRVSNRFLREFQKNKTFRKSDSLNLSQFFSSSSLSPKKKKERKKKTV